MANRIKGITVEIGGDTTKLSKALEGVNKTIKNTQTQLKDVEKLLKLDPKNTELLSQKQKLIADSISATKEKLATRCPECKVTVEHLEDKEALAAAVNNADIVINATIMGMKPHEDVTLIDKSLFRKDLVVADTVYNPEKTKMILEAEEAGCQAIGGKGMLLYQGVVNYSLFTGKDFPIEEYQKFQAEQAK